MTFLCLGVYILVLTLQEKLMLKLAIDNFLPVKNVHDYSKTEKIQLAQEAIKIINRMSDIDTIDACISHDENSLDSLTSATGTTQLDYINDYYGSEIATYFAWMTFYSSYLTIPAFSGIFLFAHQMYVGQVDSPLLPWFSILVSLWSAFLLEFWKGRNAELAFRWHVNEDDEEDKSIEVKVAP